MLDPQQMMIDRQAKLISERNDQVKYYQKLLEMKEAEVTKYKRMAYYYEKIQETCESHPAVLAAWEEFLLVAKLSDDVEEKWKR